MRPQSLSGGVRTILPLPGFDPRTATVEASRYTYYALSAHITFIFYLYKLYHFTNYFCFLSSILNNVWTFKILQNTESEIQVSVCPTFRISFTAFCIMMHWSNECSLTRVLQEYTCLSLGGCAWITGQLGGSLCKYKSFWLPRFSSWRSSRKTRSLWCGYVHGGCCSSVWFLREVQVAMAETFECFYPSFKEISYLTQQWFFICVLEVS